MARYSFSTRSSRELAHERAVGFVVLGHHEQARGAPVEAVHDARAQHAAHSGEVLHVVEQGVDEGPLGVPGAGMDHEAGRLVDDEQVVVLVDDAQAGCPRAPARRRRGAGTSSVHRLAAAQPGRGRDGRAVHDAPGPRR